jgi:hypothetical protein
MSGEPYRKQATVLCEDCKHPVKDDNGELTHDKDRWSFGNGCGCRYCDSAWQAVLINGG